MMRALALLLCLAALPAPLRAEEKGLMDQGIDLFLRGLIDEVQPELQDLAEALKGMEPELRRLIDMVGDLKNYEAPEKLPNGDIILRRRKDLPADPAPVAPPPPGSVDL